MKGKHISIVQLKQNMIKHKILLLALLTAIITVLLIPYGISAIASSTDDNYDTAQSFSNAEETHTWYFPGPGYGFTNGQAFETKTILNDNDGQGTEHLTINGYINSAISSTNPKYYTKGTAIRFYGPGTFIEKNVECNSITINNENSKNIKSVEVQVHSSGSSSAKMFISDFFGAGSTKFCEGPGNVSINYDFVNKYSGPLTVGFEGYTSGHVRVQSITVVYSDDTPSTVTASFTGGEGAQGTAPDSITTDPNSTITLPKIPFYKPGTEDTFGQHASQWGLGEAKYNPESTYEMGSSDVTFTATTWADHTLDEIYAKEATCTESGNIHYWKCTTCGMCFTEAEAINLIDEKDTILPAHHTLEHIAAKAATCTEDGNIEYWHCTKCDKCFSDAEAKTEITKEQTIIKATGHQAVPDVVGGHIVAKCTKCGENLVRIDCSLPENLNYDAQKKIVIATDTEKFKELTGKNIIVKYFKEDGSETPEAIDVGEYSVHFIVDETDIDVKYATFTIDPKSVGLVWGETTFTYDGNPHCPTCDLTGVIGEDDCKVIVSGGATAVGSGYTATASLSGSKANNYVLPDEKTKTFEIKKGVVPKEEQVGTGKLNIVKGSTCDVVISTREDGVTFGDPSSAQTGVKAEIISKTNDSATLRITNESGLEPGTPSFNVTVPVQGINYEDYTFTATIEVDHTHTIIQVPAEPATQKTAGHLAYYKCSSCGKFYEDEAATKEIKDIDEWLDGDGKTEDSWETQFDNYKNEKIAILKAMKKDGDSQAVTSMIDKAIKDIEESAYNPDFTLEQNKAAIDLMVEETKTAVDKQRADDEKKKQEESQGSSTESGSAQTGDMTYVVVGSLMLCALGAGVLAIRKRREF